MDASAGATKMKFMTLVLLFVLTYVLLFEIWCRLRQIEEYHIEIKEKILKYEKQEAKKSLMNYDT
jgi:hypothetical protein